MDEINLTQLVHMLSDMLDLVGVDDLHHGKRVAYMCLETGRAVGFDPGRWKTCIMQRSCTTAGSRLPALTNRYLENWIGLVRRSTAATAATC